MRASAPLPACTAVALVAALGGCAKHIDEQAARAVVEKVEQATRDVNWGGVHYYLSDDCQVRDTSPNQSGAMETTTKTCAAAVDEGAKALSDAAYQGATHTYEYRINDVQVSGPKAIAHVTSTVTISNRGHTLATSSDASETVEMRGGKLLITAIDEKATSLVVDGKQIL